MLEIKKQYIINESNKKVAVQLDIQTFEKIEQLLEDYALGQLIKENDSNEFLNLNEAREYYTKLKKAKSLSV
jgi:hypothetical protein